MIEAHFTSTVYIVENDRTLLIYHKKFKKWLPPGGHIHPNEIPSETAIREAKEETGLEIELIRQENVWIDQWNAKSIPRPYMCLLEEIPALGDQAAHRHIDMIFLARPVGGAEEMNHHETEGLQWFTLEEMENLEADVEIFEETKETLRKILT
ncbi:MAG: ADP-ribose pyrophosphatase YjhB (NUDIX family) [Chlamydiales bacterium]|jgi:ADP-ribose pyrophosphatase YjhB (NUDIX family)